MDGKDFDKFTRHLASKLNRRTVLGGAVGASALATMAAFGAGTEHALAIKPISVKPATVTDPGCEPGGADEWHFVITQIDKAQNVPPTILVTWVGGSTSELSLQKYTGGTAHYSAPATGPEPINATTSIYDAWKGQFNLSHGPCVRLDVSKTAETSYDRTFAWTIDKFVDADSVYFTIPAGQTSVDVPYSVMVDVDGGTDSNFAVDGTITIVNSGLISAKISGVSDSLATPNCGVTYPYTLGIGQTLTCTYSAAVASAASGTNSATVTVTQSEAPSFNASRDYAFGDPANLYDECVNVSDSVVGPLGSVCEDTTFPYSRTVYRTDLAQCGVDGQFDNTATFTTNDYGATGSAGQTVFVNAECETVGPFWCSPGYWSQHPDVASRYVDLNMKYASIGGAPLKDGAPTDPTIGEVLNAPQTYGGEAFNSVADYISGIAFYPNAGTQWDTECCPLNAAGELFETCQNS